MAKSDFSGVIRLAKKFQDLGDLDMAEVEPLLEVWERILIEDNRKGVLEGVDADGIPLIATTYRNSGAGSKTRARSAFRGFGTVNRQAWGARNRLIRAARGKQTFLAHGNLPSSVYKTLTGPPLAPRLEASRVITRYFTLHGRDGPNYFAEGRWPNVRSVKGVPFLGFHFRGEGGLPKRNLAGLRAWGVGKARSAVNSWAKLMLERTFR